MSTKKFIITAATILASSIIGGSVSAVTEKSDIDVQFTFNDVLSVSLSSPNLVISDLAPGTSADSNIITVTVSSNNPYGYTLNSTVGSTTYANRNLTHSSSASATPFSSINYGTTVADLSSFSPNQWGYSFSTDNGTTWINSNKTDGTTNDTGYSGLPFYTDTENITTLKESSTTSAAAGDNIQFKIAAKADATQLSGEYNNIINFVLTGAPAPPSKVYMQDVATWASTIPNTGDSLQAIDNRDGKTYWVTREADGNIWMTQNLDLCIGCTGTAALTSENTNLTTSGSGIYSTDYSTSGGVITWSPNPTNITPSGSATNNTLTGTPATITNFTSGSPANSVSGWVNDNNMPYMAEGGDNYVYTSDVADTSTLDTIYNSLDECTTTGGHTEGECAHYHVGNYYNWTAAIASSASNNIGSTQYAVADNSICPKGWRLPKGLSSSTSSATTREFGQLWYASGITSSLTATSYATNGFLNIRQAPLFFARGGGVYGTTFDNGTYIGFWWSSTVFSTTNAYRAYFLGTFINSAYYSYRTNGSSLRCMVQ